jgi:anaphase-promoting complex subunit 6
VGLCNYFNSYSIDNLSMLQANSICKQDPLVCNELGVLFYHKKDYRQALAWLRRALDILTIDRISSSWAPTVVNLGHVYRKLCRFDDAVETYVKALGLMPNDPCTLTSLGYTHHMTGRLNQAIELYHKALAFKADCGFTTNLLAQALKEHCDFCCKNDDPGLM